METTSVTLLQRLRGPAGPNDWARLVELYTPLLVFWARRLGLQPTDAEDLVQDVFATLVRKLRSFTYDRDRTFRGWLRTLTINKWRDRRRKKGLPLAPPAEAHLSAVASRDGLDHVAEAEDRQRLVRRALEVMQAEFEPTTWKACWESVVEGRPAAEVGARLGISENAVYIAKCRVLRRLRQELDGLLE